jgi:molecular chaperone DnaJ
MARDYYEVLGVPRTATPEEVIKAYRTLAKKYHPDRNPGDKSAEDNFKEMQEAFETIGDPQKRSMYDLKSSGPSMNFRRGKKAGPKPNWSGWSEDVISEMFGGSVFRGRNIQVRVEIDLQEVLLGCTKTIKVKKRKRCAPCSGNGYTGFSPCTVCSGSGFKMIQDAPFNIQQSCVACQGTGKASVVRCSDCLGGGFTPMQDKLLNVKIPSGIGNGMAVRIPGEGEESQKSGQPGDVMVVVLVKDHPIFRVEGFNLVVDIPVSYTQLTLGGKVEIPTLDQGKMEVEIPAGSQSNTRFRLKGRGLPDPRGLMGDLVAAVKVETPKVLDEEYRKVLDQLAELEKRVVTPRREAWSKKVNDGPK